MSWSHTLRTLELEFPFFELGFSGSTPCLYRRGIQGPERELGNLLIFSFATSSPTHSPEWNRQLCYRPPWDRAGSWGDEHIKLCGLARPSTSLVLCLRPSISVRAADPFEVPSVISIF